MAVVDLIGNEGSHEVDLPLRLSGTVGLSSGQGVSIDRLFAMATWKCASCSSSNVSSCQRKTLSSKVFEYVTVLKRPIWAILMQLAICKPQVTC